MEKLIIANAQYSTIDALLLMHVGSMDCTNKNVSGQKIMI